MEKDKDNNMTFEDSETFKAADALTIKQIVLKQVSKCIEESSKEMDSGGVRQRIIDGHLYDIYAPNQVEIFINSCKALFILLKKKTNDNPKVINQQLKLIDKKLDDKQQVLTFHQKRLTLTFYQQIKKFSIKSKWEKSSEQYGKLQEWYNKEQKELRKRYDEDLVEIYRELLTSLITLLEHIHFFEEKTA